MIEATRDGDVTRLRMWTPSTRAAGYDVSAYLVRGVMVDTGFRHAWRGLRRAITELKPRGAIVTHWHEDHAGNAPYLVASGMPVWMYSYTETKLRERPQVKLYRHIVWGRPRILDGSVQPFDPLPLRPIATPGHSPDHHVVLDEETRTLFSADLWLGVRARIFGESEDPYELLASLGRMIELRPERMFDAHRGRVDRPVQALQAKRDWLADMLGAIELRLSAGDSERSIVRRLLGGEELAAFVSQGEYARRNLVRAVARIRKRLP